MVIELVLRISVFSIEYHVKLCVYLPHVKHANSLVNYFDR